MNIPMNNLNSIAGYNKVFDQNLQQFNKSLEQSETQFDKVLNQQTAMMDANPPVINGNIELNVGLENMGITPIEGLEGASDVRKASPVEQTAKDFGQAFSNGLNSVNNLQADAESAAEIMASGGDISAHDVMIAAEKANISMQMAIQLRNKIISAYNEINNVRI